MVFGAFLHFEINAPDRKSVQKNGYPSRESARKNLYLEIWAIRFLGGDVRSANIAKASSLWGDALGLSKINFKRALTWFLVHFFSSPYILK